MRAQGKAAVLEEDGREDRGQMDTHDTCQVGATVVGKGHEPQGSAGSSRAVLQEQRANSQS